MLCSGLHQQFPWLIHTHRVLCKWNFWVSIGSIFTVSYFSRICDIPAMWLNVFDFVFSNCPWLIRAMVWRDIQSLRLLVHGPDLSPWVCLICRYCIWLEATVDNRLFSSFVHRRPAPFFALPWKMKPQFHSLFSNAEIPCFAFPVSCI